MSNGDRYFIEYVDPIKDLNPSPSQPSGRTESGIKKLIDSISDLGLQYPPLVTRRNDGKGFIIIDGHRRIAAWKEIYKEPKKMEKMPVMVATGTPSELFTAVTGTIKPITTMQWLEVHLKHGQLPTGRTKSNINSLEAMMGTAFLEKLRDTGVSPSIWNVANQVVKYLELGEGIKKDVIHWILEFKLSRQISEWVKTKLDKRELKKAFEQRRRPQMIHGAEGDDLVNTKAA